MPRVFPSDLRVIENRNLVTTWKPACGLAWVFFSVSHVALGLDKAFSENPICPNTGTHGSSVSFMALGGLIITWAGVLTRLILVKSTDRFSDGRITPVLVSFQVLSMSCVSIFLQTVFNFGGTCVDALGVTSHAPMWFLLATTVPLLLYLMITLVDKSKFDKEDYIVMACPFFGLICGFLLVLKQPRWVTIIFLLVAICTCMLLSVYPLFIMRGVNLKSLEEMPNGRKVVQQHLRRHQLAVFLALGSSLFGVVYFVALFGFMSPTEIISSFHVCCALTQGNIVHCVHGKGLVSSIS